MDTQEVRQYKTQLYEQFARIGKALAHAHRLELLNVLIQGEHTVERLAQETGMSLASASQHLQVLRAAHLVEVRRVGVSMYYRLASHEVSLLWLSLQKVGEQHLAELDRLVKTFVHEREQFQPISAPELIEDLQAGNVFLIDVRPTEEYQAGHLPGAISMPLAEIEDHLTEIPQGKNIVAYCRGPYCVSADNAVTLFQSHAYPARRLMEGVAEWQQLGYQLEEGRAN